MFTKYLRSAFAESLFFPLSSPSVTLSRSLYQVPYANFARKVAAKPLVNLTETMEAKQKEKKKFSVVEDTFANREDPKSKDIDDQWLSLFALPAQHLPEKFLRRAHKVFAKFPHSEVRKMGKSYMKLYQFLHATEKPTDISELQPFANTSEVLTGKKSLIYLGKKYRYSPPPETKEERAKATKENSEKRDKALNDNEDPEKGSDQGIEYDQNTALAYLQRKVPHTFGVACRILTEIKFRLPDFQPKTFLDFGAGLGSGAWAFQDVHRDFHKIVAIEPSASMRKLGKYLTQDIGKIDWFDSLARLINVHDIDGTFDVVYCGFVLEEVKTPEARQLIIDTLWQKVKPGGVMILVEPGSPKGFRFVHDFRRMIVDMPRTEANIIAPCPHQHACPQAKPHHLWCNFDQAIAKFPNQVFSKLPKQSTIDHEKFSFMVARKGEIVKEVNEDSTPAEKSFFWPRVLRPTLKRGKHIIMDLCNTEGEIERRIVAKSHNEEGEYKQAKKLNWGDLWCYGKRIPNKFRKESRKGERLW